MAVRRGLGIIVCGVFSSIIILGCGENEKISLGTQPTPIEQTSEAPSQPTPIEQTSEAPSQPTPVEQTCEASSQPTSASTESDSKYQRGSKGVGDPYFPNLGNGGYDVQRYLIDIEWDPLNEILSGWTTIEAETTENLSSFNVDLNPNMIVSEVTVNGDQACFIREGTEVTVQPVNNLSVGSNFEARFSYTGKPGLVQLENAPFAGGWFSEPWTQENGSICMNCILYVLGEPSSSMAWHPVNDHPSDRAQFRIEIATVLDDVIPKMFSDWEFITNGYLISKEKTTDSSNSEITTWIYETRYPRAPYLTVLAYGPFIESDAEDLGDVQLRHWADTERIYPGDYFEFGKETIGFDYDSMFEVFTNLFGPYPFDTYGYLVLGDPLGLALETQTLSIFGVNTWQAPFIHVHELAHQWFGNYITVDNWSEIWLNEGFATYSEYLYEEATTPEYDIFLEMRYLALMGDSYDVPPGDPGPEDLFHPSVYNRSALTLHALRMTIGDDAFFTSIRKYVDDFGGTSVTTTDFIQIVESVSGADLEDFFARWLYDTEMPDLPCMGFRPCGE